MQQQSTNSAAAVHTQRKLACAAQQGNMVRRKLQHDSENKAKQGCCVCGLEASHIRLSHLVTPLANLLEQVLLDSRNQQSSL